MSRLALIWASLRHHRGMNLAVGLGAAVAAAVLSGALLVGDSMRASLRRLTLERLGRVSDVLASDRFFGETLAEEMASRSGFSPPFAEAVPVVLLQGTVERPDDGQNQSLRRAGEVNLIGCDERFWRLGDRFSKGQASEGITLNEPLARLLDVVVGDMVVLRIPKPGGIPAESPLGRKTETTESARLRVTEIVPAAGLGRFGLSPSQQLPRNAYVPIDWLQRRLERLGKVNAILAATPRADAAPAESSARLAALMRPTLADLGLRLERTRRGYFNLTSDRMILSPEAEEELLRALSGSEVQPALTNLAVSIGLGERTIPYSTIAAVDFATNGPLGPLLDARGEPIRRLAEDEIVLNAWAADDLGARPGDTIEVSYFDPAGTLGPASGKPKATPTRRFRLVAVTPLSGAAADPDFVPEVEGVTDRLSMAEWNPPFEFHAERIRPKDEKYWDDHAATPKAFVSLAAGRKLWSSRFGRTTSLRIAPGTTSDDALRKNLEDRLTPERFGMAFQPVKALGLAASAGATPFGVLFLSFSFFLIVSAVLLQALLFRLNVELRSRQIGTLLALGFSRRRVQGLLAAEGLIVALGGGTLGTLLGVGYAALMLWGLRTWWVAAVATPFLRLHVGGASLLIGFLAGVAVAVVVILLTVRSIGRVSPRALTSGEIGLPSPLGRGKRSPLGTLAALLFLLGGGALSVAAVRGGEYQPGMFFGAGSLVLLGLLGLIRQALIGAVRWPAVKPGRGNLVRLAARNAARRPGRSLLAIGLVAAACFLIIAISAFYQNPASQSPRLDSGNGGFALVAQTDQPLYHDLNTREGRGALGFSDADSHLLAECRIVSFRVKPGDDASCLNLYQARRPTVLGVPDALVQRGGFAWAAAQPDNPWAALRGPGRDPASSRPVGDSRLPVILDKNTAVYSLHLYQGLGERFDVPDDRGTPLRLEVVGLLDGGLLQGCLLIDEAALLRRFPEVDGFRFFLIDTPPEKVDAVREALERTLGDVGMAVEPSGRRLAGFLVVQNTYLSTFQSLGGLGLLLGTLGLAVVQWRNVIERRAELALLRAAGWRRRTLALLVLLEHGLMLTAGMASGVLAAMVAVTPHLLGRSALVPWSGLAATLGLILLVGLVAGLVALRAALAAPLLPSLRAE